MEHAQASWYYWYYQSRWENHTSWNCSLSFSNAPSNLQWTTIWYLWNRNLYDFIECDWSRSLSSAITDLTWKCLCQKKANKMRDPRVFTSWLQQILVHKTLKKIVQFIMMFKNPIAIKKAGVKTNGISKGTRTDVNLEYSVPDNNSTDEFPKRKSWHEWNIFVNNSLLSKMSHGNYDFSEIRDHSLVQW